MNVACGRYPICGFYDELVGVTNQEGHLTLVVNLECLGDSNQLSESD